MKPNARMEGDVISVLEGFCSAFAERNMDTVMRLVAPDSDVVVITSEEALLRGPHELRTFLESYVRGATTYSWEWDRHDVSAAGSVAWLLAEGTETAATGSDVERHHYRMTMVLERRDDRWLLMQVHGSSPH
jgi:ketosteroid isomerase-like protein